MPLTLTIENETALVDGGPLTYTVKGKRGFDVGRDSHLDWTLPDPSRHISSKHCEVRYRDNAYWLHDVSTNGTFLNGSDRRMSEPHRLHDGDRITIGHFLIRVALDEDAAESKKEERRRLPAATSSARPAREDLGSGQDGGPPLIGGSILHGHMPQVHGRGLAAPSGGDFLDWMADLPPLMAETPAHRQRELPSTKGMSWAEMPEPQASSGAENVEPERPDDLWDLPAAKSPTGAQSFARPPRAQEPKSAPAGPDTAPQPQLAPAPAAPIPAGNFGLAAGRGGRDDRAFVRAFAAAAGIPESILDHHDDASLALVLGGLVRLTVEDLQQLLAARFEAKRMARSSHQTQIGGMDNNPLKFSPTVEEALKLMLGPASRSYLDATRTLKSSFADIKTHQLETYAAMQTAVLELTDDFDPRKIDAAVGPDGALGNLVGSRKARAWDIFVARWDAKTLRRDNGILGAFMEYFSKNYDRGK